MSAELAMRSRTDYGRQRCHATVVPRARLDRSRIALRHRRYAPVPQRHVATRRNRSRESVENSSIWWEVIETGLTVTDAGVKEFQKVLPKCGICMSEIE